MIKEEEEKISKEALAELIEFQFEAYSSACDIIPKEFAKHVSEEIWAEIGYMIKEEYK